MTQERLQSRRRAQPARNRGPLPFAPYITEPPVLACDHAEGVVDGHDRLLYAVDDVLNSSVLHHCASRFITKLADSDSSVSVCDCMCKEKDCELLSAGELPNRDLLTADAKLTNCDAVRPLFFTYLGDNSNLLNGLVLQREGFESTAPHRLRVCSIRLADLRKNKCPKAAKANVFFLGDFPAELKEATWVEMLAAGPVRLSGTIIALEQLKSVVCLVSEANLQGYPEDGSTPQAIQDALISVTDRRNTVAAARSTHAHGNREPEQPVGGTSGSDGQRDGEDSDRQGSGDVNGDDDDDGVLPPCVNETKAVMPSGSDLAKSSQYRPTRLRALQAELSLSDSTGPASLAQKHKSFLFFVCVLIFRREAIKNARWKLTGRVSRRTAETLATITPEDLAAAGKEMEQGSSAWSALANRNAVRTLLTTMESVHAGSSWTIYNKSERSVASALYYHSVTDAVLTWLLRVDARDGDGGVLGRVKGYLGMTEEQRRVMLHSHVVVWVYGFNEFSSFRDLMDKRPEKYKLARFLERVIFNQVASFADVNLAMHGHDHTPRASSELEPENVSDPLVRPAKERMAQPPSPACFPRQGVKRCPVHDDSYARLMYLDLAELVPGAQLHRCQPTCHKFNNRNKCRFRYGDKAKSLEQETTLFRGPCTFHTNGGMTISGVVYPPGDPSTAESMVAAQAFQNAFNECVSVASEPESDRFTATVRRLSTHINPYNPIIHFLIRSNMDSKVMLRDSDARGLLYYVLHYSTKSEQTLDVLLPLLFLVVQRKRCEKEGEPAKETAVRLVRSCLCKQLTSLNIDGPAAASKVFGLPDAKISHTTAPCSMRPSLAWAPSRDAPDEEPDDGDSTSGDDQEDSGDEASDDQHGVVVSVVGGRLTVNQRAHVLYLHRCLLKIRSMPCTVMRQGPVMVNIMRDIPRSDTKPEAHCRLLLCTFVTFFEQDDLKLVGDSWTTAMANVEQHDRWDKHKAIPTKHTGMLRLRIAADEEWANRKEEEAFVSGNRGQEIEMGSDGGSGDVECITTLTATSAEAALARQESTLTSMKNSQAASLGGRTATTPNADPHPPTNHSDPVAIEPYLVQLHETLCAGLSQSSVIASNARRNRNNQEVARTDMGAAELSQHPVAFRIAQEFGLNREQRFAFYIFANCMFAKKRSHSPALILYIGGGAGAEKSWVLKAIKTFIGPVLAPGSRG
ncbi:unnamed protein product [Ectocarpus sp. CCAP 1310/34]|nr:unnamed protein product [Ectocarpus sp. CCAP 1310/34]